MLLQNLRRTLLALTAVALLAPPVALAQGPEPDDLMAAFGRRTGGTPDMTVVHLNDLTTDLLFEAPSKYSLRAQARQATMFYVQGTAQEDVTLDLLIEVIGAQRYTGRMVSIQNFEPGAELSAGDPFIGLITIDALLPPQEGMRVNIGDRVVEFTFTANQLAWLDEAANPGE